MSKKDIPSDLADLLHTPLRIRVYETAMAQTDLFSVMDIVALLRTQGYPCGERFVQNTLKALRSKNYLEGHYFRDKERRGAFAIGYQVKKR